MSFWQTRISQIRLKWKFFQYPDCRLTYIITYFREIVIEKHSFNLFQENFVHEKLEVPRNVAMWCFPISYLNSYNHSKIYCIGLIHSHLLEARDGPWTDTTWAYFWPAVNKRPTCLWPGYFLPEEIFLIRREKNWKICHFYVEFSKPTSMMANPTRHGSKNFDPDPITIWSIT